VKKNPTKTTRNLNNTAEKARDLQSPKRKIDPGRPNRIFNRPTLVPINTFLKGKDMSPQEGQRKANIKT